jgi:serine/threonine protein kinase
MTDYIGENFGNYHLIQRLGQGGFADVYLGEHVRLGRKAAIKILQAHLVGDDIRLFQQEAQIIAGLKHPHIIRLLDFDVREGVPFLVLDYAPHGSLRQKHSQRTTLSLPLIVDYVTQVASALQYAHDQKLIHRDVKPENMLIDEQEQIVLSDFGIATIAHATSSMSTQASMGTLVYMAPEQIQGKARPASDQYALAVTVYSWLAGSFPFQGSSTEIIAQHLGGVVPSFREQGVQVAPEVEQVVLTALAKDLGARFGSVQAFANALAQASGETSPSLRPFPVSSPMQPTSTSTVFATPQMNAALADSPPVPTTSATPLVARSTTAFLQSANAAFAPKLRRQRKPWMIGGAIEGGFPILVLLAIWGWPVWYQHVPSESRIVFADYAAFLYQIQNIYSNCVMLSGLSFCEGRINPFLFFTQLPNTFYILPSFASGIVAFLIGYVSAKQTAAVRPGIKASLWAVLCFVIATFFVGAFGLYLEIGNGYIAPSDLLGVFVGLLAYLCIAGGLAALLSVIFAIPGGLLGRKFAPPMPGAVASGGPSAGIRQGGMTPQTHPGSTEPSPEIADLAAQHQLGELQLSAVSSGHGRVWIGVFAGLLAAGCLVLGLVSQNGGVLALWLLFTLVFGGLSVYGLTYTARHGVHQAFLFVKGLIDAQGTGTKVFPWDRIAEVWIKAIRRSGTRSVVYTIRRDDGLETKLNTLDFGTSNVDTLGAIISEAVVRSQLPRALAAMQSSNDLTFGPITLNAQEIRSAHHRLLWSEVGDVTVENGFLYVLKPGQMKLLGLSVAVMHIPNLAVLLKLVASVKQPS